MPGESSSRLETIYNDCVSPVSFRDTPQYNNTQLTRKVRARFRKVVHRAIAKGTGPALYRCFNAKCRVISYRRAESVINLKNERRL